VEAWPYCAIVRAPDFGLRYATGAPASSITMTSGSTEVLSPWSASWTGGAGAGGIAAIYLVCDHLFAGDGSPERYVLLVAGLSAFIVALSLIFAVTMRLGLLIAGCRSLSVRGALTIPVVFMAIVGALYCLARL
jgi:hypothetical protein